MLHQFYNSKEELRSDGVSFSEPMARCSKRAIATPVSTKVINIGFMAYCFKVG